MVETSNATGRRYIYAIIRSSDTDSVQATGLRGLFDEEVRVDPIDLLAVVSSCIDAETIRPRRQLLTAHQHVVAEIAKHWDLLPVAFGLIANDDSELHAILSSNIDELSNALERVSGMVEMNLVVSWTVENVFQHLLAQHPELQAARDRAAAGQASREEMIEVGRQIDQTLKAERGAHADMVRAGLADVCTAIEFQDAKSESEIVRAQCLIAREGEEAFTQAIHRIADQLDNHYSLAFNGPWPPYSFVNLKLSV